MWPPQASPPESLPLLAPYGTCFTSFGHEALFVTQRNGDGGTHYVDRPARCDGSKEGVILGWLCENRRQIPLSEEAH